MYAEFQTKRNLKPNPNVVITWKFFLLQGRQSQNFEKKILKFQHLENVGLSSKGFVSHVYKKNISVTYICVKYSIWPINNHAYINVCLYTVTSSWCLLSNDKNH